MRARRFAAFALAAIALITTSARARAQTTAEAASAPAMRGVVIVTRHGVRTPTNPNELDAYIAHPWPVWEAKPGDLTPHGAALMTMAGAAYRARYSAAGLIPLAGCPGPGTVFVWADVDERTQATARALLDGFAPQCGLVANVATTSNDPLFHALPAAGKMDAEVARATVASALGPDPKAVVGAHAAAFAELDALLGCTASAATCTRVSSVSPSGTLSPKTNVPSIEGAVDLASAAVEDLLLAYTDGKSMAAFGAPDFDAAQFARIAELHALKSELTTAAPEVARAQGSNLLAHLSATIDTIASGTPVDATRAPATTRFALFAGHDTNLSSLGGLLKLRWQLAGYQPNDTPPGGALIFEIYGGATPFVRTWFAAQSLDQMRTLSKTEAARTPVYVPGCPSLDCPLSTFDTVTRKAIDPNYVLAW